MIFFFPTWRIKGVANRANLLGNVEKLHPGLVSMIPDYKTNPAQGLWFKPFSFELTQYCIVFCFADIVTTCDNTEVIFSYCCSHALMCNTYCSVNSSFNQSMALNTCVL